MTCVEALELLLAADPAELEGSATTPLTRHLVGCARCRRVADRLLADMAQFAVAVRAEEARTTAGSGRRSGLLVLGAAATMVVALLLSRGEPAPRTMPIGPPVGETAAVSSEAPARDSASPTAEAPTPRSPMPAARSRARHEPAYGGARPIPVVPATIAATRAVRAQATASTPMRQRALATRARAQPAEPAMQDAGGGVSVRTRRDVHPTMHPDVATGIVVIWLD
jgi:hypothetical protein